MGNVTMGLRIAARSLWRRPAFSGVAVATLALSIGAATLLFSVVDGVLLTPLPYDDPDALVGVYLTSDEWRESDNDIVRPWWDVHTITLDHAEAFRAARGPIESVTGYTSRTMKMDSGQGSNESAQAVMVDGHTFAVLGAQPMLGRLPTQQEVDASARVAVLRHRTWSTRFGSDADVLGRSFRLADDVYTVIGVMPPDFFFPTEDGGDLWIPVAEYARTWPSFYGLARVSPGTSLAEATDFFERTARRLGEDDPERSGFGGRAVPHMDNVVGNVRGGIRLLFGTALIVVLVACVNLANLFLARTAGRREELAVRASLGAGSRSQAMAVMSEALVIGAIGGVLGIALAWASIDPFVEALGTSLRELPRRETIGVDGRVLFFSLAATLGTTLLAGIGPALTSLRGAPRLPSGSTRWSGASRATRRTQRVLLSLQAALTVSLVSAAALLGQSFLEAISVDMGMDTQSVAVLRVEMDVDSLVADETRWAAQRAMRARLASLPGLEAVAMTNSLPARGGVLLHQVRAEGDAVEEQTPVPAIAVTDGYFETLGIPVLAGRGFGVSDDFTDQHAAVVSESLALQLYGRTDVLGRSLITDSYQEPGALEIVGVVGEARQLSAFQEPQPTLYHFQRPSRSTTMLLTMRVRDEPEAVLDAASRALATDDGRVRVVEATTLTTILHRGSRHIRLRMILMASLAALAGVLAVIGISGVVAHYLSEQTRDVGIRMALGAAERREVGRVVRHALTPTVLGLVPGVVVARASSGVLESFVFGVDLGDPLVYGLVSAGLLAAAALAAWIPARRTAGVDPARVLSRGS